MRAAQHPEHDQLYLEDAFTSHHISPAALDVLLDTCLQNLPSGAGLSVRATLAAPRALVQAAAVRQAWRVAAQARRVERRRAAAQAQPGATWGARRAGKCAKGVATCCLHGAGLDEHSSCASPWA